MPSVNARFLEFCESNRFQDKEIATLLGISTSGVSAIRKEKSIITTKSIIAVAEKFPELSLQWLITGKGEMNNGSLDEKEAKEYPLKPPLRNIAANEGYGQCVDCRVKDKEIEGLKREIKQLESHIETLKCINKNDAASAVRDVS
nr:helix-turn-helix domain-containing protein [uncultured Draconibacterium sp.]